MAKHEYYGYVRKSLEESSRGRQTQSVETQLKAINDLTRRDGVTLKKIFIEEKSAKQPGRKDFDELMAIIERNDHTEVYCWLFDRLSRNPRDGGWIQWYIQQGKLTVVTSTSTYDETTNAIITSVEDGQSTQYSRDLSFKVKGGMQTKVKKGWRPGRVPLGYFNDPTGVQGEKIIYDDKPRQLLIHKMGVLVMRGMSVPGALKEVTRLGLTTKGGAEVAPSTAYALLANRFLMGEFKHQGEWHKGNHTPVFSPDEFDLLQRCLGQRGKPRPRSKRLPFNNTVTCGDCGCYITCDEKWKIIKSTGELKRFIYHRPTRKKKNTVCKQKPITHENMVTQIKEKMDRVTLHPDFTKWALEVLRRRHAIEEQDRNTILQNLHIQHQRYVKRLDNLIELYTRPENEDRSLLTDEEFKQQKVAILQKKHDIEEQMRKTEQRVDDWVELTEKTFHFATYAKAHFDKGDFQTKTAILNKLGQKFVLNGDTLHIELKKPYMAIRQGLDEMMLQDIGLELTKKGFNLVDTSDKGKMDKAESIMSG